MRRKRRLVAEMNVVPYIDVMLVLLVIFMVTAPLLKQGVEVDLPQANNDPVPSSEQQAIIVSINAQGEHFINIGSDPKQAQNRAQIAAIVAAKLAQHPKNPVMIGAASSLPYSTIIDTMAVLQQAGAPKVGLLTAQPDAKRR